MDLFAPRHLLIILLIVLVVFGTKKLTHIASDLGGAVKGFKKAMADGESLDKVDSPSAVPIPAVQKRAAVSEPMSGVPPV